MAGDGVGAGGTGDEGGADAAVADDGRAAAGSVAIDGLLW
jgi:hypothetical protein